MLLVTSNYLINFQDNFLWTRKYFVRIFFFQNWNKFVIFALCRCSCIFNNDNNTHTHARTQKENVTRICLQHEFMGYEKKRQALIIINKSKRKKTEDNFTDISSHMKRKSKSDTKHIRKRQSKKKLCFISCSFIN
jgi:hypothetical protein